jgi:hypothetical protein
MLGAEDFIGNLVEVHSVKRLPNCHETRKLIVVLTTPATAPEGESSDRSPHAAILFL